MDTHIFLWMITDRSRVSPALLHELQSMENEIYLSAVVAWEISNKRAKGKLDFSGSPRAIAQKFGLIRLPITDEHCEVASELPAYHGDPFDRLLVAQAQVEGLVLATGDPAMARYGIRLLKN